MLAAPPPDNEPERLRALKELRILDTIEERAYDDLALLAAQICRTPIALVSLVDRDRQWFKSHYGLPARETARDVAFCAHAIHGDELFMVDDSTKDLRFHDNPLVSGAPHVQFYAGAPLILRDGIRVGTLCVIDHQARHLTDDQQQALRALARQVVNQMELRLKIEKLQQLDHAKDEFISVVNHELRTPLTSINGALGLLYHRFAPQMDPNAENMLEIAYRNTERLLNIVNDILDVAQLDAGKLELHAAPLNLTAVVGRAVELNRIYCERCGCQLIFQEACQPGPVMVWADEQRLLQVLANLISNAAKFTGSGDTVEIVLRVDGGHAAVGVTDHGPGIPPERQGQLFSKFSQLGPSGTTKLPGTGLGLNICRRIIELHNGEITCDSIPNQRTTFAFTLPLVME